MEEKTQKTNPFDMKSLTFHKPTEVREEKRKTLEN